MNPPVQIHLELRIDGAAPIGHATLEGGDPRPFSGWVGLVSAVEELVNEQRGLKFEAAAPEI
ncbi:hypothetical protein OJ998_09900 [Solirubrobacter taibaiensis]|nr:hypothetical protein [Solirubrobacter taibaiensis]